MIHRLPSWAPMAGVTLPCGSIWVKRPEDAGLVHHEQVHVEQIRRMGCCRFFWRYLFSISERIRFEAEAYALNVKEGSLTVYGAASILSGPLYGRIVTMAQATSAIGEFLQ